MHIGEICVSYLQQCLFLPLLLAHTFIHQLTRISSIRRTCRIRSHLTRLDQIWTEVCLGFPLRMMKIWMQESHPCNATSAPTHTRTRNNRKRRGLVVTLKISQGRHCRVLAAKRASEHFHHYIIQEKDRAHWTNVSGTTRGKLSQWNPPLNK